MTYIYVYIYIYICVCVCVIVFMIAFIQVINFSQYLAFHLCPAFIKTKVTLIIDLCLLFSIMINRKLTSIIPHSFLHSIWFDQQLHNILNCWFQLTDIVALA